MPRSARFREYIVLKRVVSLALAQKLCHVRSGVQVSHGCRLDGGITPFDFGTITEIADGKKL